MRRKGNISKNVFQSWTQLHEIPHFYVSVQAVTSVCKPSVASVKKQKNWYQCFPHKPLVICVLLSRTVWLTLQETGLPAQKETDSSLHNPVALKQRLWPYKTPKK
jgi:hypothetical protein